MILAMFAALAQWGVVISVRSSGTSIEKLRLELERKTHVNISIPLDMRNEIVIVDAQGVPLPDILRRLAWATDSTLEKTGEGWKLNRDGDHTLRKNRFFEARAAEIASAQKQLNQELERSNSRGNAIAPGAAEREREAQASLTSALAEIVANLPLSELASLAYGDKAVFAESPRGAELVLGASAERAKRAILIEELRSLGTTDASELDDSAHSELLNASVSPDSLRLLVRAERRHDSNLLNFDFILVKGNESVVAMQDYSLARAKPPTRSKKFGGATLPVGIDAVRYGRMIWAGSWHVGTRPEEAALKSLLRPSAEDPLSFVVGQEIIGAARSQKANTLAVLPDSDFLLTEQCYDSSGNFIGLSAEDAFQALQHLGAEIKRESDWISIRPASELGASDRAELSTLLNSEHSERRLRLDALAALAAQSPDQREWSPLVTRCADALLPSAFDAADAPDWESAKMWGLIPGSRREEMKSGRSLRLEDLPPAVGEQLKYQLFEMAGSQLNLIYGYRPDCIKEPLELLPRGLPPDVTLSLGVLSEPVLLLNARTRFARWDIPLSIEQIAIHELASENPAFARSDTLNHRNLVAGKELSQLRPGTRTEYLLVWNLGSGMQFQQRLADVRIDLDEAPCAVGSLPQKYTAAIEKEKAFLRGALKPFPPEGPPP